MKDVRRKWKVSEWLVFSVVSPYDGELVGFYKDVIRRYTHPTKRQAHKRARRAAKVNAA